jgi:hypothetical protein
VLFLFGGPGTNIFPKSIPIDVFTIFSSFMIDLGSLCLMDVCVAVLGTLWGQTYLFSKLRATTTIDILKSIILEHVDVDVYK